jgi:transposase InsO family protein
MRLLSDTFRWRQLMSEGGRETVRADDEVVAASEIRRLESPENNGMAEAFVETFKRDCVRVSPIPNAAAALALIDNWMDDYNTVHPHSQLGYRSPLYDPSAKPGDDDQKGDRPADQKPLHRAHRYPPLS